MSSELVSSRKAVVEILKERVTPKLAESFEKNIFDMCQRLSKEYNEPVIDFYNKYAYEKTGHIIHSTNKEELDEISQDIENDTIDWDSAPYKEFRKRLEEISDAKTQKPVTEPSAYKCKSKDCGSRQCIQTQIQTRGGDEATTTFVTCMKCSRRYRID
jgi:DNA-directed RNA polymerase subunit M/transcription elongation factor TFIIS